MEEMPGSGNAHRCRQSGTERCSDKELLSYVYQNIRYPEIARANNIEGWLWVRSSSSKKRQLCQRCPDSA